MNPQAPASALAGVVLAALAGMTPAATGTPPGPQGDAARGKEVYARCGACHALGYDRVGPRHCGLFGRRAGSVAGFGYSAAMKKSGIVWSAATLDRFLAAPTAVVPGTTMGYGGIPDARDRADLLVYLRVANGGADCRK